MDAGIDNKEEKNFSRYGLMVIILTGSFLAVLNQTVMVTIIPHIMDEFNLTESSAQWVTTIFMLVNGIMIPITAFLMETFTSRRLFLFSMVLFIIGTIICYFSISFPILLVGRVVQAIGAGIMMPLMTTILMLIFPIERRGFAMGMSGLVISFAPAIGPSLSGYIVEFLPWRSIFLIILPIAIIDLIFAYFFMRDLIDRTFPKVDFLSIILSVFGFGGLLLGFSSIGNVGWSHWSVITSIIVGAISLTLFIRRQFTLEQPILEFRVFSNRTFTYTTIIGMIAFTLLIAGETILPIYMQVMAGFTALEAGLVILPGALLTGILSPIIGRVFDAIGARTLLIVGLAIVVVTTIPFTRLTADVSLTYLTVVFAIRMVGISMVSMPSQTAGLNVLDRKLIPHGTAMTNTMRQVAASIGTASLITIMTLTARTPKGPDDFEALIHGVNISFYVSLALSVIGLILAFFVRDRQRKIER